MTVELSAHSSTVPKSIRSTACTRRTTLDPSDTLSPVMAEPTRDDVDALVGPATPHFAYQIRARLQELVAGLPEGHEVRRYAESQMERLDRLATPRRRPTKARASRRTRLGWDEIPSAAPADRPLPRRA